MAFKLGSQGERVGHEVPPVRRSHDLVNGDWSNAAALQEGQQFSGGG